MAVDLTRTNIAAIGLAVVALLVCAPVGALGPNAPFVAPAAPAAPSASGTNSADSPASAASGAGAALAPLGLSGMRLRTQPMALIDGEWRRVGESVRGAAVTAMHATGVTLRHPDGRVEVLSWGPTPAVAPAQQPLSVSRTQRP